MKKHLIWFQICLAYLMVIVAFCYPRVEAYGQAKLQYDKGQAVYFVETENFRMDVTSLQKAEEMYDGKPISFLKAQGREVIAVSGNESEAALRWETFWEAFSDVNLSIFVLAAVLLSNAGIHFLKDD